MGGRGPAGNAVRHGSSDGRTYLVRLIQHPYCFHVEVHDSEVHDSARHSPFRIPPASPSAEAGRGMRIVQGLCDDWVVQARTGQGKAVWTCLRRPEVHTSRCSCTP
ncbi:ATP-binding protein [Streptomyces sp. NPDC002076]